MNEKWDLGILYGGFDDENFKADMSAFDESIKDVVELASKAENMTCDGLLKEYIGCMERYAYLAKKLYIFAYLRYNADTGDMQAMSVMNNIDAKMSGCAAADAKLNHIIASYDNLEKVINENAELAEFKYLFTTIKNDSKYLLGEREEEIFSYMDISGASAWEGLHDTLTSTVKVNYRGEEITLSAVRNLAYDADKQVRRDAYQAELDCYKQIDEAAAFSLNSIKLQVINECRLRGFASPLDKALHNSRMKKETLDALLEAMNEYMPSFWKYLRAKAKALGYEGGLPWYELFAPMGKNDKKYTVEEARDYLLDIFGSFDKDIHDVIKNAFDNSWIDFFPRNGKVGGAFDCGVPSAKQSRVLTNFDGAFTDIVTLAHELGHSFHDSRVFENSVLNQEYSMPVAETASTFNEVVVVTKAIEKVQDKDVKLSLIESQLSDACQIICDIYSRYLFESAVFEKRPEEFLNSDALCELMLDAQRKAYGDGLDQGCLHPYMWLCKGHYYSGSLSFYNFPYAFGGLFARGLYAKYLQEGDSFLATYKKLLRATGTNNVEDTALIAGIDLTDKSFWEQGLKSLADEIDEFCAMVE